MDDKEKEIQELKRIIEILDQEGVEKCEKLEKQAKQIKKLEKALDKACEWIADSFGACPLGQLDIMLPQCENCEDDYIGCWKEWLFKEVQEDE